jgi:tRNA (guanine10-N2)-methyltransferase
VKHNTLIDPSKYQTASFRFDVDSYMVRRTEAEQLQLITSFNYLPLHGRVRLKSPDLQMCIFEDSEHEASTPHQLYLGRWIAKSNREAMTTYDLKKRRYISRTSMEAELALVTANMVLAAPGKIVFDPFVGTGSFTVSCAHFGAITMGSDIDGRSIRGTTGRDVFSNFQQYGTVHNLFDNFISDLTHTPLRSTRFLDGIVCDPPYGVREGPKVLGYREGKPAVLVMIDGVAAHL